VSTAKARGSQSALGPPADAWFRWKSVYEQVRQAVISEVVAASDVSETDLQVLIQLHEAGGMLRQNALATATGWDRTRLSHLLTRMESRGYVTRRKITNGVEIMSTDAGTAAVEAARKPLENAVSTRLLDRLDADDLAALDVILAKLAD
jgi:DNA-binding MarR family transcriptional regulator